jgi:GT2 family glycosyltransferase
VAIVILNWNGKHFLQQFLPSVLASDYENLSVIVADNASTDDSISFLRENFPTVKILINEVNEGFAKGYNSALRQVEADYYILLNSDVEVSSGWIAPVILLMENDENIAACQPKILSFERKTQFEYAGAAGGWIDRYGYPFARGRMFEFCEEDVGQYDDAAPVFWASGAAMFVRSTVFHQVNGFDEFFFAHQEEIDLCWRMQRLGYSIYVEPLSVIYHVGGGTLPTGSRQKVFLNFRNNLVMLSKNLPFGEAIWKIPARIVLDMVAGLQALTAGNFSTFISIESAHLDYLKWLFLGKRHKKLPVISMKKFHGVFNGSVVWQYFINKKKTFLQIPALKK